MPPPSIILAPEPAGNLPVIGVALAALLYWLGGRRHRRLLAGRRAQVERWRTVAFVAALAAVILALQEPLDGLADELFWAHMLEHVLLLVVVAPLLVLAAPWMRLWRAFPLRLRRPVARGLARGRWAVPVRHAARGLGVPGVAWGLLNADVIAWHVPALYDLTLRNEVIHDVEHLTFLAFAVLAWAQLIDSPPLHARLSAPRRATFALGSMVVGWALAVGLAFASTPWYAPYAHLRSRPGGLSALADQHLGAGIMWVPASLPWALTIMILLYRWVGSQGASAPEPSAAPLAAPAAPTSAPSPVERELAGHAQSPS